ncbi:MAG: accessory gene regulator B family protein [Clostridia bacterium]|nr:accessory gene regulator B family protein [Clostridia bacterium]
MATGRNTAEELAHYLSEELNINQRDAATIRFGLELILGSIIKLSLITAVSLWLGITPYVLTALLTSSIFRLLSGGVHCHTYWRCVALGLGATVLIGSLAPVIGARVDQFALILSVAFAVLIGLYCVHKWAPADNPKKPITNQEKRRKFRQLSYLYVLTWGVALTLLIFFDYQVQISFPLAVASLGGFLTQVFSLTPVGYRLVNTIDATLGRFLPFLP